jgi:hypothetical protein
MTLTELKRTRPHGLFVRVSTEEKRNFEKRWKESRLQKSEFIRYQLCGYPKPMTGNGFEK